MCCASRCRPEPGYPHWSALRHCTDAEAGQTLEHLPLRLADHLTRGQAEDLLARLIRERIDAKLSSEPERSASAP